MSMRQEIAKAFDGYAVSLRKVQDVTKMTEAEIEEAMDAGLFPRPTMALHGMRYWCLGDIFRFETRGA